MHTATSLLPRYTACFILKILSKIDILTDANYSKCKLQYDFFFIFRKLRQDVRLCRINLLHLHQGMVSS